MSKIKFLISTVSLSFATISLAHAVGAGTVVSLANITYDPYPACLPVPTCESLGYTYSSSSPCPHGNDGVKCPMDTSLMHCPVDCSAYTLSAIDLINEAGEYASCTDNNGKTTYRYTKCNTDYEYNLNTNKCEIRKELSCKGIQVYYPDGCRQPSYSVGDTVYWNSKPIGVVVKIDSEGSSDTKKIITMMGLTDLAKSNGEQDVGWFEQVQRSSFFDYIVYIQQNCPNYKSNEDLFWDTTISIWDLDDSQLLELVQWCNLTVPDQAMQEMFTYTNMSNENSTVNSDDFFCSVWGETSWEDALTHTGLYQTDLYSECDSFDFWSPVAHHLADTYKPCDDSSSEICYDWTLPSIYYVNLAANLSHKGYFPNQYKLTKGVNYWSSSDYVQDPLAVSINPGIIAPINGTPLGNAYIQSDNQDTSSHIVNQDTSSHTANPITHGNVANVNPGDIQIGGGQINHGGIRPFLLKPYGQVFVASYDTSVNHTSLGRYRRYKSGTTIFEDGKTARVRPFVQFTIDLKQN